VIVAGARRGVSTTSRRAGPIVGEFGFEIKFKRREDLRERAMGRAEAFLRRPAVHREGLDRPGHNPRQAR